MKTVAEPTTAGCATLLAVILCVPRFPGGWYSPEEEIVPTVALPPVMPSTAQTTAWLVVFATVAVNCCVSVKVSAARPGCTVTPTAANRLEDQIQKRSKGKRCAGVRPNFIKNSISRNRTALFLWSAAAKRGMLDSVLNQGWASNF